MLLHMPPHLHHPALPISSTCLPHKRLGHAAKLCSRLFWSSSGPLEMALWNCRVVVAPTVAAASLCWRATSGQLGGRRTNRQVCNAVADSGGGEDPSESSASVNPSEIPDPVENSKLNSTSTWKIWQMNTGELRERVAKLGRAGLLAYGLFNGITYTSFFVIAFLGYERSTGQNPAANLKACLGVVISMWTGNNFTRPLRVAGAAALAPVMDIVLKKTQTILKLRDEASAFFVLVTSFIVLCASVVGLLILSRWGGT